MSTKDEFVAELHRQLDQASKTLDVLQAKANVQQAEAKAAFQKQINDLERRKSDLQTRLHEVRQSGENAYEKLANGCHRSWDEFKAALDRAYAELK